MTIPLTASLKLLLQASSLVLNDGDNVSAWADSSGQANNAATYAGSTAPKFKTSIFGTYPAVRFGGAATDGLFGAFSSFTSGAATIFLGGIFSGRNAAYGGYFVNYASGSANDYDNTTAWALGGDDDTSFGRPSAVLEANNQNTLLIPHMPTLPLTLAFTMTNVSGVTAFINGTKVLTANSGYVPNPTNYLLGQRWLTSAKTVANGGKMDLGIAAVYDAALTDSQIQTVSAWGMNELSISSPGILIPKYIRNRERIA